MIKVYCYLGYNLVPSRGAIKKTLQDNRRFKRLRKLALWNVSKDNVDRANRTAYVNGFNWQKNGSPHPASAFNSLVHLIAFLVLTTTLTPNENVKRATIHFQFSLQTSSRFIAVQFMERGYTLSMPNYTEQSLSNLNNYWQPSNVVLEAVPRRLYLMSSSISRPS